MLKFVTKLAVVAVVALALVAGSSSADAAFSRYLTVGSTGADVTELQTILVAQGYLVIPAGTSMGYFGTLTKNAVAKWQAAVGLPATGYFGPMSIAKIYATSGTGSSSTVPGCTSLLGYSSTTGAKCDSGSTGGSTGGSSTGGLSGDEANLSDFELRREESTGDEGEEEVQVFTAEFDVEDGDIRVERMEILASSTDAALEMNPWDYFDRVTVWADGKEIAEMDVDDRDAWDEESADDVYRLTFTNLDYVVREDDRAEITVAFDIAGSIDSDDLDQEFVFQVPEDGIRAIDAEGIDQYVGDDSNDIPAALGTANGQASETVTFGFGEEENGDLSIKSVSEDPDSMILISDEDNESDEYTVFAFEIDNDEDVDALITDLAIGVTDGNGSVGTSDIIRRATLVIDGDEFDGDIGTNVIDFDDIDVEVAGDDSVSAELMITLVREATSTTLVFDVDGGDDVDAEGVDSGDTTEVSGAANSSTHSIAVTGIDVAAVSTNAEVQTPGQTASTTYGTYTVKFKVTAVEDNAYIATTTATSGTVGVTYSIGGTTFGGSASAVLTSTADTQNGFYVVDEGDNETFTLTVTLDPNAAGTFEVDLNSIRFNDEASFTDSSTFSVDSNNDDFQTDPKYIPN